MKFKHLGQRALSGDLRFLWNKLLAEKQQQWHRFNTTTRGRLFLRSAAEAGGSWAGEEQPECSSWLSWLYCRRPGQDRPGPAGLGLVLPQLTTEGPNLGPGHQDPAINGLQGLVWCMPERHKLAPIACSPTKPNIEITRKTSTQSMRILTARWPGLVLV